EHRGDQALGAEVARGSQVEVFLEVLAELALRRVARRLLGPRVAMVDSPDAVREALPQVSEDDSQPRMRVEEPRSHQPQRVDRGFLAERPGGAEEPRVAFVDLRCARQRVARMQVERNVQLLALRPEAAVARVVEVNHGIFFFYLGKPVDEGAAEYQLLHAPHQL